MKTIISIILLTSIALCSFAGDVLEFKLAQEKEHPRWVETEYEGKSIWVNPTAEIDSQHIASAEVVPGFSFYTHWLTLNEDQQAELKEKFPDMISQMDTNTPPADVVITLTEKGGDIIKKTTTEKKGYLLAIICEGKILIAPQIYEPITDNSVKITLSSKWDTDALVSKINTNKKVEPRK